MRVSPEHIPYLIVLYLAYCDFLLWRHQEAGNRLTVSLEDGVSWFLWSATYGLVLFAWFYDRRLLEPLLWSRHLERWLVLLLPLWLIPLPAVLGVSEPWQRVLLWLFALLPVFPLKPPNYRFSGYRAGLLWRSVAVPPWSLSLALLFTGIEAESLKPLEKLFPWFGAVLVLGLVLALEYAVDWKALQQKLDANA